MKLSLNKSVISIFLSDENRQMAFGSWFKNIIKGAKNLIGKAMPVLKKGAELVSRVAPIAKDIIGGSVGDIIGKVGDVAGKVNNRLSSKNMIGGDAGKRKVILNTEQYPFLNDY